MARSALWKVTTPATFATTPIRSDGSVASGRLLAWRDEHRQHVHTRADFRLWPVRLYGKLRPRLHLQPLRSDLMAQWQAVGFSHGVMNTDNMSILGLTFDYGPFGFMESYDPGYICNHSDPRGRYAFDRQPQVGLWNLACLAQALSPLIHTAAAHAVLDGYAPAYHQHHVALMGAKLGLSNATQDDIQLIVPLLEMMHASQLDYTNLFRSLGNFNSAADATNNLRSEERRVWKE